MRNFSKKLAFVLAAAMVFTAFAPAAKADAAEKEMAMNRATQTLYVNKGVNDAGKVEGLTGNKQAYDFYVANKPANWKTEYTFDWSSSDEDVITVGKAGLATAVAVGKAQVICVVTDKATKVETKLTADVTVKANADDVYLKEASLEWDGATVAIGETVDLDRVLVDANGNESAKRGTYVTDLTRWVVEGDNADSVKVNQSNGQYTFTEAGEYTLYCETYQSEKYSQATATSEKITVTVEDAKNTFEAEQESLDTFVLTFDKAVASLSDKDLSVKKVRVNAATGKTYTSVVRVKSAALDAKDKTKATVTIFGSFADATDYDIAIDGFEESYKMTAHAGLPVAVEVYATIDGVNVGDVLVKGKEGVLKAKFIDENGIDVTKAGYTPTYTLAEYSKTGAYTLMNTIDGAKLVFKKTTEVAPVNVKYQKRDGSKLVVDINETFYFGAEEPDPIYVTGVTDFSLNGFTNPGWNKQSLQLKEKDCYLTVKVATDDVTEQNPTLIDLKAPLNEEKYLIKKADGQPKFSFTAVTPEICNITSTGLLVPYKADTAAFYVNMQLKGANGQYGEAEPIDIIYINVDENSKFDGFSLDKHDVTVGNVAGAGEANYDKAEIKATLVDQYGNKISGNALVVEGVSENAKVAVSAIPALTAGQEQIITIKGSAIADAVKNNEQFKIADGSAASFEFKVKTADNKYEQYFTVTVMTKGADDSNYVEIVNNNVTDALRVVDGNNDNYNAEKEKVLTFSVFTMNNGVKVAPKSFEACPTTPDAIAAVSAGKYFYKVTKNGQNINGAYVDTSVPGSVSIKLSGKDLAVSGSAIYGSSTVNYRDTGAGEYTFELFYSWYDGQITSMDSNTVVVTLGNAGAYAITSAESDTVTAISDYTLKDNEVSNITADKNKILKCFKFSGRDGKEVDLTTKLVDVKYDATAGTNSVYVESITVYEALDTDYVAYTIPVNVVLVRK